MPSKETLDLINTFRAPLLAVLKDIKDEVTYFIDNGIVDYVENIRNKYSKTKTFLYRLETVNFYDVYFPITLKFRENNNYHVDDINDLFNKNNFISIIGNAGSGKSMLLKHVFLKSIMQITNIPIVIELRNLNNYEGTFIEYINYIITGKKLAPNTTILERILHEGHFLFLLDGYDEIYSRNKEKYTHELIDFIDNYSNNYFLIASRPGANVESIPRFDNYIINELTLQQVNEFVVLQLKSCGDEKLINKIIEVINKPESRDYNSFLRSPLLLSMFIFTFNSYPELPKSKNKFYWNVFDTLCTRHDAVTKYGGFQHERKTKLQNEELENILKWFSYISLFQGKYSFDEQYLSMTLQKIKEKNNIECSINDLIDDLTVAISIIIKDGLEYKFPHKSLQEYFAILLIKDQNEENKRNIYSKIFEEFFEKTFGGNHNFWDLCQELDKLAFNKYFLLDQFHRFLNAIDTSTDEKICYSYIHYFNYSQQFTKNDIEDLYSFGGSSFRTNVCFNVFMYFKIPIIPIIEIRHLTNKLQTLLPNIIEKGYMATISNINQQTVYILDFVKKWDSTLYSFVKDMGFQDIILTTVEMCKEKKQEIELLIAKEEKNNRELLGL
jgi:hypothetical protein